jgi:two-component sensor histidine kinase
VQGLWNKISRNGISEKNGHNEQETKRLVFFNQILFIGFIAALLQIPSIWPFLGADAFIFLFVCIALITCLMLNKHQQFGLSKWLYVLFVFSFGTFTTTLLGGSALYHIQSVLIFFSCLILFDWEKEKYQIIVGIPFMFLSILIGEFGWFGAPDFSAHPSTPYIRVSNILSIICITTIFITFITRLNKSSENKLSNVLNEVIQKSQELEKGKTQLESIVHERTSELVAKTKILSAQNEEKIVLLKEVHHRVRNNLQIIISLINLQLDGIEGGKTSSALREIQSRVRSMSIVHQKMYQTSNFKDIKLVDYAEQIIENLSDLYDQEDTNHELNISNEYRLEMDDAIPMGLILNEIISNYFKHCYTDEKSEFTLNVTTEKEKVTMIYSDNGAGFNKNIESERLNSLGLQLISNLSEQLDGTCNFKNDNGAVYSISIPRNKVLNI